MSLDQMPAPFGEPVSIVPPADLVWMQRFQDVQRVRDGVLDPSLVGEFERMLSDGPLTSDHIVVWAPTVPLVEVHPLDPELARFSFTPKAPKKLVRVGRHHR